ncbi:hypothetical protein [Spirillospora sp. CA-294931]|uniref:hypothetical protein n=1 Tax=Spirillospora sp. CA-294931 TaxID=3240042 RepID=UPI003D920CAD
MHHRPSDAVARYIRLGLMPGLIVLGLLAGIGYGTLKPKTYSAEAHVMVIAQDDSGPLAASFAQALGRLAPLPGTLALAADELPVASTREAREHIQVSTSPDVPLIRLTGSASSPSRAARYADAAATALVRYGNAHSQETGVRIALMNRASAPADPTSPNPPVNILVGLAAGILLAMLAAFTGLGPRGRLWPALGLEPRPARAPRHSTQPEDHPEPAKA